MIENVDPLDSSGYDPTMRLDFGAKPWPGTGVIRAETPLKPVYMTDLGRLYEGDCLKILQAIENDSR